jgi:copper chaperone CopZ
METINLRIPTMKSAHCMMTVTGAIKKVGGATIKSIAPGEVEMELSGIQKASIVEAVEKAGYLVANK